MLYTQRPARAERDYEKILLAAGKRSELTEEIGNILNLQVVKRIHKKYLQ